jgi:hypothetical protein
MKAPDAPDVATVPTPDATADTTVVVRRGRGKPLGNGERIRSTPFPILHTSSMYYCICSHSPYSLSLTDDIITTQKNALQHMQYIIIDV